MRTDLYRKAFDKMNSEAFGNYNLRSNDVYDAEREGACLRLHVNRLIDNIVHCLYIKQNHNHEFSPLVHENAPDPFPGQDDLLRFSAPV